MKHLLLIFICLLPWGVMAQHKTETPAGDRAVRISTETDGVWTEWHKIDSVWMYTQYGAILQKFKLRMDCERCTRISMDVDMTIDSSGKLAAYHVVKSYKCGVDFDSQLQDAFMNYFYGITFPAIFRKTIFSVMLGTGLKC